MLDDQDKVFTLTEAEYEKLREEARYSAGMSGVWGSGFEAHIEQYIGLIVKSFFGAKD